MSFDQNYDSYFCRMEDWMFDFEWLRVRTYIKEAFDKEKLPDMKEILFLIGIQELGRMKGEFSKEEKQDLMHIATCELLTIDGYYKFLGRDQDGWPHYEKVKSVPYDGVMAQEEFLKQKITQYFSEYFKNNKDE